MVRATFQSHSFVTSVLYLTFTLIELIKSTEAESRTRGRDNAWQPITNISDPITKMIIIDHNHLVQVRVKSPKKYTILASAHCPAN